MARLHVLGLVMLGAMACLVTEPAAAFTHIVGGRFGWNTPNNSSYYQNWAKPRTFGVGDKLVFPYRTGVHSLVQVSKEEFENCTQNNVIDMFYSGPTIIELPKKGEYFYYCGVGTHCEAGQKLGIAVVEGEGSAGSPIEPDDGGTAETSSAVERCDLGMVSGMLILMFWVFV